MSSTNAVAFLTSHSPKEQAALIKAMPEQEVRKLLQVAVQLLWGEDIA